MSEGESKTIVGVCEEISEKNGWTTFHINVGSQYPIRLSTKLPALVAKGRSVGDGVATWRFKEVQGKENPNRPGTFYQNRYMDDVEAGAHAPVVAQTGTHPQLAGGDRERSIIRQTALKAASALYAGAAGDDPALDVIEAAARFERWVLRDLDEVPSDGAPVAGGGVPYGDEPDPTDDIPFVYWEPLRDR